MKSIQKFVRFVIGLVCILGVSDIVSSEVIKSKAESSMSVTNIAANDVQTPTRIESTQNDLYDQFRRKTGFPPNDMQDIYDLLKSELDINELQINEIQKLRHLNSELENANRAVWGATTINERSNGRAKADQTLVQKRIDVCNAVRLRCVEQYLNLKNMLGSKYNIFEMWLIEQAVVDHCVRENTRQAKLIDSEILLDPLYNKVLIKLREIPEFKYRLNNLDVLKRIKYRTYYYIIKNVRTFAPNERKEKRFKQEGAISAIKSLGKME